jgi:hypothetical protein
VTMLQFFEDEIAAHESRVLDVRCASCGGMGTHRTGETCEWCKGAGWLILGDHEPPCIACNDPRRSERPAPPGYWWEATS